MLQDASAPVSDDITADLDARVTQLLATHPPTETSESDFLGARFDAGLAWVHFPVGHGGLGIAQTYQAGVDAALDAAGAPGPARGRNGIGLGMAAPTIAALGTEEQRARFLRPLYTGEHIYCQLFSEPGAGSDLAGVATRAVRDGDSWVVNGQKVWTSGAHNAQRAILVARTDPGAVKHSGLTYFVVDMSAPGIEIRPLRQVTGEAEFNEVFLTGARTSADLVVGEPGDGWKVAMGLLGFERGVSTLAQQVGFERELEAVVEAARANGSYDDPVLRDRIAKATVDLEVMRLNALRGLSAAVAGEGSASGGGAASIAKLVWARWHRDLGELAMAVAGPDGLTVGPSYDLDARQRLFLFSRADTIYGGSDEVQRTILAERVLGLPKEPRG